MKVERRELISIARLPEDLPLSKYLAGAAKLEFYRSLLIGERSRLRGNVLL